MQRQPAVSVRWRTAVRESMRLPAGRLVTPVEAVFFYMSKHVFFKNARPLVRRRETSKPETWTSGRACASAWHTVAATDEERLKSEELQRIADMAAAVCAVVDKRLHTSDLTVPPIDLALPHTVRPRSLREC